MSGRRTIDGNINSLNICVTFGLTQIDWQLVSNTEQKETSTLTNTRLSNVKTPKCSSPNYTEHLAPTDEAVISVLTNVAQIINFH